MLFRSAQTAREEYTGLKISLELAYENIRMREEAFAQGLSTSLEVVDAELFLVGVKTQQQAAAYQYVLSLARMLALSDQMAQFPDYQLKGQAIKSMNEPAVDKQTIDEQATEKQSKENSWVNVFQSLSGLLSLSCWG